MAKAKTLVVLDAGSADKLGVLLAQIKDLTDQADGIKDAIDNDRPFDERHRSLARAAPAGAAAAQPRAARPSWYATRGS